MKEFLEKHIYLAPILMLIFSFISAFVKYDYVIAGNAIGYSIITNIVFFTFFYYRNYCIFTKLSSIGLFLINIVDIIGYIYPKYYSMWYTIIIVAIILTLSLLLEINKHLYK